MSQFRTPMQFTYGREASDGSGMQPASSEGVSVLIAQLTAVHTLGYILAFQIPRYAEIISVELYFTGTFAGKLDTITGRNDWVVSGIAVGAQVSNTVIAFDFDSRNLVTVAGAAAALTAPTGTTAVHAIARWKAGPNGGLGVTGIPSQGANPPQWSSALFSSFSDDADGDTPSTGDLRGLYAREENRAGNSAGGSAVVVLPGNITTKIPYCNAGYSDPWGKVFLTSADIGTGVGQISTETVNWQASQFLNHPQVFMRLGDHVRGFMAATPFSFLDSLPLAGATPVMRLYIVDRMPEFSTWLLIIDGLPHVVTFQHPAGVDLRRPSAIYAGVVAPAIQQRSAIGGPGTPPGTGPAVGPAMVWEWQPAVGVFVLATPAFPADAFRQREGLPRRVQHLQYARILDLGTTGASTYDDPPYTEVDVNPVT